MTWATVLSLSVLVFCACGAGEREPQEQPEHGWGSVDLDSLPVWALEEDLRIGSVEDPDVGFSQIEDITVGPDGTVFVLEAMDRQVRVYDSAGNYLRRFGGRGRGPGEIGRADAFGLIGDTVWVRDELNRRFSFYSWSGELLGSARFPAFSPDVGVDALRSPVGYHTSTPLADGGFLAEPHVSARFVRPREGEYEAFEVPLLRLDASWNVTDTLGWMAIFPFVEYDAEGRTEAYNPNYIEPGPFRWPIADGDTIFVDLTEQVSADGIASSRIFRIAHRDTVFRKILRYRPVSVDRTEALFDAMVSHARNRGASGAVARRAFGNVKHLFGPDISPPVVVPTAGSPDVRVVRTPYGLLFPGAERTWLVVDLALGPIATLHPPPVDRRTMLFRAQRILETHDGERFWRRHVEGGIPYLVRYRVNRDPDPPTNG